MPTPPSPLSRLPLPKLYPLPALPGHSNPISHHGYDLETQRLIIVFSSVRTAEPKTYEYVGVPPDVYQSFLDAPIPAKFFYANIAHSAAKYPYRIISTPDLTSSASSA